MGGVVEEQEEEEVAPATPATSTDNFTDGPPSESVLWTVVTV